MGGRFTRQRAAQLAVQAAALDALQMSQREIAAQLGVSQPTVCTWLRRQREGGMSVQARAAAKIRAELVCCDIFEQMQAAEGDLEKLQRIRESKVYHDVCYFGEWAARIVEGVQ